MLHDNFTNNNRSKTVSEYYLHLTFFMEKLYTNTHSDQIITVLGNIAGFWGSLAAFYVLLFGRLTFLIKLIVFYNLLTYYYLKNF